MTAASSSLKMAAAPPRRAKRRNSQKHHHLNLFATLPHDLLERLLSSSDLHPDDLAAFTIACTASDTDASLDSVVEAAAQILLAEHPLGCFLADKHVRLPNESALAALSFVHLADPAIAPRPRTSLWACGRNDAGQGARSSALDSNTLHPCTRLASLALRYSDPPPPILSVAAGGAHSACLTVHGMLHVTGSNARGQLGLGNVARTAAWTPVLDLKHVRVAHVVCGHMHTAILTADGTLLTTGANDDGQLAVGDFLSRDVFSVAVRNEFVQIAAGRAHTIVLHANGSVWGSGSNAAGQLGGRPGKKGSAVLRQIDCFGRWVIRVACGCDTTMLLTADNMILVSGKRQGSFSVIGGLGTSHITHLSTTDGFALARTDESEVAISTNRKRFVVTDELLDLDVRAVSSGIGHYVIVTSDGHVLAAGANAYGQVGTGEMGLAFHGSPNARLIRTHRVPLSRVDVPEGYRVLQVAAGAFHTLFVLEKLLD